MGDGGLAGLAGLGVIAVLVFWVAVLAFMIALFVAPFKLYGIHKESRYTNALLKHHSDLLMRIEEHHRTQEQILGALLNAANTRPTSTPVSPPPMPGRIGAN